MNNKLETAKSIVNNPQSASYDVYCGLVEAGVITRCPAKTLTDSAINAIKALVNGNLLLAAHLYLASANYVGVGDSKLRAVWLAEQLNAIDPDFGHFIAKKAKR